MSAARKTRSINPTLDPAEQARFASLSGQWWAEGGELDALKAYNPVRLAFIRGAVTEGLKHKGTARQPLKNLSALDIGCGGGLLAEPLARMGAKVTGIDATPEAIAAARSHARNSGLEIDYRVTTIERFAPGKKYDLVIASEVLEHVADAESFLTGACSLLRPGGVIVVTTFNRTLRSLALGIIAAEHILKVAPVGTHSWKKFLKPSEVAAVLRESGVQVEDVQGALYNPLTGRMRASRTDLAVNYMLWGRK